MTAQETFDRMSQSKAVRITPEFREYWGQDNLGQWFDIIAVSTGRGEDATAEILSRATHQIFGNVDVCELLK